MNKKADSKVASGQKRRLGKKQRLRIRRSLTRLGVILLAAVIFVPAILVLHHTTLSPEERADTLIVLGCRLYGDVPSLLLKYRLDKALELYAAGMAGEVIVSGAMGEGETVTEAYAMKKYLVERGVPAELIHMEDRSHNTYENLKYSQEIMQNNGLATAIIVSNDFHIFRSLILARKLGITAQGGPSEMPTIWGLQVRYIAREIPAIYRELIFRRGARPGSSLFGTLSRLSA
jgi:uncharacterized SAM-binding protein YcdF (DUF218 family)